MHILCKEYAENLPKMNRLLLLKADPNTADDDAMTPLLISVDMHNKSISSVKGSRQASVRHLLNSRADPGHASYEGNAIHHALWGALADAKADPIKPKILAALLETDPECVNIGNPGNMLEHRAESDNNTPLQRLCMMDNEPCGKYGAADPELLASLSEYLCSQKADYRAPDGRGVPPRRVVRSDAMRKFFNKADKISQPGSPAQFGSGKAK